MQYCPIVLKPTNKREKIRQENNKLLVVQLDATLFITIKVRYRQKTIIIKNKV